MDFPGAGDRGADLPDVLAGLRIHLATNTVREIIPAITIAEHFSFHVDEYVALNHSDFFEKPGFGWFIDGNPELRQLRRCPTS